MIPQQAANPAQPTKRTVYAPPADVLPGVALSVELADDEQVQWQWSPAPDGRSRITGYEIIKSPLHK